MAFQAHSNMSFKIPFNKNARIFRLIIVFCTLLAACTTDGTEKTPVKGTSVNPAIIVSKMSPSTNAQQRRTPILPATRRPEDPILTPTPNVPRILPTLRTEPEKYAVQQADSLGQIARRYGISINDVIQANNIQDADKIYPGQVLVVPPPQPKPTGPQFKILPDSEFVYGPSSAVFDIESFVNSKGGYLSQYKEDINGTILTGTDVIKRVSQEYSVSPKLLLAILENRSGWVTQSSLSEEAQAYPIAILEGWRTGLYRQLIWTANVLNQGYYLWKTNGIATWSLPDGSVVPIEPTLNPGSTGIQYFYSLLLDYPTWLEAVSQSGFPSHYQKLFGYPFDLSIDPLIPTDLTQPVMQLPFEKEVTWSFTGGPHGGWGDGSAWSALDFGPPGNTSCNFPNETWITAVADGQITRSEEGVVILDLDEDGFEQTGWTVLYLHISSTDRIKAGLYVKAGDKIGHPSCEGGVSNAIHVHLARRYNGEWIPADGALPFNLDDWVSFGDNVEYNGFLKKAGQSIEAWDSRRVENQIHR
jgi:murein DD-endopeptidase MepM/ murein hydrolase activator NlpD